MANKKMTALAAALAVSLAAAANHPDSVYVKPDVQNGTRNFQIAYSIDKVHWKHIDCNLFESDYGPWGSEKKLYYPVLRYDGKTYHATFIPNPGIPQIATTQSEDFALWKPQDYPFIAKDSFPMTLERQKRDAENNVITIPYAAFQALLNKKAQAEREAAMEAENYIATAAPIAADAENITARITIDADDKKAISADLMGIFFEDISYAADGGLYAELIQNRDFEYSSADHRNWNAQTAWSIQGEGTTWSIETADPLHKNNAHYALLKTTSPGAALVNYGWDGIAVKAKGRYILSLFVKGSGAVRVSLVDDDGVLATCTMKATAAWKQQKTQLTASRDASKARLTIEPLQEGELAVDFVSLFPKDTFKGRANGLRKDLAEVIADLKPRFVRFPGGCASHGQGIDNIYHWQATVGDLWERQSDMNIWKYHQTRGLGFYEYFTFCEDIGAEALPVLAAGVPCQNSWKGGNGQQGGIPFEKDLAGKPSPYTYNGKPLTMESYLQELLDLIEWANGDARKSPLAALRTKAGHPAPFNMKYLGIGNEDLISDVFLERYTYLVNGIRKAHPEITVVGTVGPFWQGSDYEYGWRAAKEENIPIVDEHYYNSPGWYFNHRDFYDNYDRKGPKVYLGEWASKGNNVSNALVEAAYLTNVERNADVVCMSSYAPLLAKEGHTNWSPDMIYFNNTEIRPTANYYVQRAFGHNSGDVYVASAMAVDYTSADGRKPLAGDIAKRIDKSVVIDSKTGDVIVKIVSMLPKDAAVSISVPEELLRHNRSGKGMMTTLVAPPQPDRRKAWESMEQTEVSVSADMNVTIPAFSFAIIRIGK